MTERMRVPGKTTRVVEMAISRSDRREDGRLTSTADTAVGTFLSRAVSDFLVENVPPNGDMLFKLVMEYQDRAGDEPLVGSR